MVRNGEIRKQAITFRKRGFTYAEIAKICGVHKATVARWCSGMRSNTSIGKETATRAAKDNSKRIALLQKARQTELKARYQAAEQEARTSFRHYRSNPLFMSALLLYAAQGDTSTGGSVRFTSSNPQLHRIWRNFLVEFGGLSRDTILFWLLLYASHDEKVCSKQWSKALGLHMKHFGKTQVLKQTSKTLHFGTGNTIIGNTVLKRKILVWIELTTAELQ